MPTQKKIEEVEAIKQLLERASITVSADYRGLRVTEMQQLRRALRDANVQVRVIKNNLLRLAADGAGMAELMDIVEGPTALVFSQEDPTAAAKAIDNYARSAPAGFAVKGAYIDGQVVTPDEFKTLVNLPPREVMIAQLAGQLQAPIATFAGLIESPLRQFAALIQTALSELPGLIEARARQLESQEQS